MSDHRENPQSVLDWLPRALRPLSRRLALLMVLIVTVMMVTVLALGYRKFRDLAGSTAHAHLLASATQLRSTLQAGARRVRRDAAQFAAMPAVGHAATPLARQSDRDTLTTIFAAERKRNPQTRVIALWSADGRIVAIDGDRRLAEQMHPVSTEMFSARADTSTTVITPLTSRGDSVFFSVVSRVTGTAGNAIGYLVSTRQLVSDPRSLSLLRGLVGPEARLLLGNRGGDLWTDFSRPVTGVGVAADTGMGEHASANGTDYLHAIAPLGDAPWSVMVDVPQHWVAATAGRFVADMVIVALVLVALGSLIIWATVAQSLRPLGAVTAAVAAVARGDRLTRVPVRADDEIGRLGLAFNSMATQVSVSATELARRAGELEESNATLQESEQRYRALVDHLPDGILVHRDLRVSFANRACAELMGATHADELMGRSILDFIEPADRDLVTQRSRQIQQTGIGVPTREVRLLRGEGKRRVAEATSMPIVIDGRTSVQTILRDVTDRQLLEEQLRQSQKMDAIGRLAGGVAHDFNNILTVIDAHAEFAMRADEDEATRAADIQEIRRASGSAARLTRQLLAFSRKQAVAPVRIDLTASVEGMMAMLRRLLGDNIAVTAKLEKALWPIVADASHIEQVLMNLAVNARDAMPDGGTLTFQTGNVRIGPDYRTGVGEPVPEGEYALLTVEDTGHGMSSEVQAKVFEPFFTTKPVGSGTGLGLATVYGIVKQSGGHIWLYSELDHGTSVKILLPRHRGSDEPAMTRTSEHRISAMTARILLVEDQPNVRVAISRTLRTAGFVVHEAVDAASACDILANEPGIDLILTDMMMPGETGAEFAGSDLVVSRDIPVIIMSGYSQELTNREWRLPPNSAFIDKPVSPTELIRMINTMLG